MPIYEFYCAGCHTIFNFLSRRINVAGAPKCPKCARETTRKPSTFAMSRNLAEPKGGKAGDDALDPFAQMNEGQLESAMASIAEGADSIDENDPRQAAGLMRQLFGATGMPVGEGMQEALKRMEAGEDPEKIEEDMGEVLEADPFAAPDARAKSTERRLPRRVPAH